MRKFCVSDFAKMSFFRKPKRKKKLIPESEYDSYYRKVRVSQSRITFQYNKTIHHPRIISITVYQIEHFIAELKKLKRFDENKQQTKSVTQINHVKARENILKSESNILYVYKSLTSLENEYLLKYLKQQSFDWISPETLSLSQSLTIQKQV